MKKWLYKVIFFKLMGWKISGRMEASVKKCVIIVVPHTSWHDFYIGLFTRGIVGLEMNFVAKKELFIFPFGYYFRWMGGAPLDRSGGLNKVDTIAGVFHKKETFRLAIAPEGTRKKVTEWRTGFYYIALQANVPVIPVAFDYGQKEVKLGSPFYPTGKIDEDIRYLQLFYRGVTGRVPENGFEVNE